ncbi:MAG TPA: calcium/proton exchanger, partial [Nitrolancea sp.]|nr:calcium/proton exchanger [Nitrolancea sp.]
SALALVPLAALLGDATEQVAIHTGSRVGGLLNATFGNAAELIITIVAVQSGLVDLAKASISGSIIGNILLVLGASLLIGGLKNGRQYFNQHIASVSATMMTLAVVALLIPAMFTIGPNRISGDATEHLSMGVALVLLVLYGLFVLYTIFLQQPDENATDEAPFEGEARSIWFGIGLLIIVTVAVVVMSEVLIHNVEPVIKSWGVSELFLGVILIPIIGNVAEHFVAVQASFRNKMDLSIGIAVGSSLQVALFVAPVLVFVSFLLGHKMTLVFNEYELAALVGAITVATFISMDGESNWLEGAQLLAVYVIVGLGFFYLS